MHRFFLPASNILKDQVSFPSDIAHQLNHVLRMKSGEQCVVLDNLGNAYDVELVRVTANEAVGKIILQSIAAGEPLGRLSLYLCLTQRDKFEWMLQKCTEVGASSFTPVISSRSLVQNLTEVEKKRKRWEKIICEAAEQSGRGKLPVLETAALLSNSCQRATRENHLALIPWEEEYQSQNRQSLSEIISNSCFHNGKLLNSPKIALIIGPEGGFTKEEVDLARSYGNIPISLGPRILRVETAAIVAITLVLYELGDLDNRS